MAVRRATGESVRPSLGRVGVRTREEKYGSSGKIAVNIQFDKIGCVRVDQALEGEALRVAVALIVVDVDVASLSSSLKSAVNTINDTRAVPCHHSGSSLQLPPLYHHDYGRY